MSPHEYSSICVSFESNRKLSYKIDLFYLSKAVDRNDLIDGWVIGEEVGVPLALNFREWTRSRISQLTFAWNTTPFFLNISGAQNE